MKFIFLHQAMVRIKITCVHVYEVSTIFCYLFTALLQSTVLQCVSIDLPINTVRKTQPVKWPADVK